MLRTAMILLLLAGPAAGALAAGPRSLDLPGPDVATLAAEDAAARGGGGPERFASPYDLSLAPDDGDGWDRLPDGSHRWRLLVSAPGSLSLNFGFRRFDLPWGARLVIAGRQGPERTFTAADNREDGQLWTPVVLGDTALVTLVLPPGDRDRFALELQRVSRGYRYFGDTDQSKQGVCNIDVVCPEGDPWRRQIRSVAVYTVGGSWRCSGAMINNTGQDGTPYFLTANHCGVTSENAATVTVYWNFMSPECGQLAGGSLEETQTGAIWRASYVATDMTLLELSALPDTASRVSYAGWDRRGIDVAQAVAIHHPSTDEKAISFEHDPLEITSYLSQVVPGNGTHWRVVDWDLGTTEPGSSGSPLFDQARRIIGQLHGGDAACGNDESDWYGRFALSWEGGGDAASQLAPWLDPTGSGAETLDIYDPYGPQEPPVEPDGDQLAQLDGARPNPAVGSAQIHFRLARAGHAKLSVYDLRGRRVVVLLDADLGVGDQTPLEFGAGAASGRYFCRLEALGEERTCGFTLLR
ncbi:MAG TPA: hypothetical protein PLL30_12255 [Candidatus Krumholzibacteria bacterium]|nr:hypothetical protein [Candidatus Krumholzibacteria bacterium]HPD72540.1 hypothetical protein [Candidatus Krumholzibacteria bacterium]HRY40528.1 hypothetical protein [Candidatus Krumholzibacteria bacterium]